jgi:predicted nucleotidyltransferase
MCRPAERVSRARGIIGCMTRLVSRLAAHFCESGADVVSAYLFGSRAHGAEHLESDVDVAVLFDRDKLLGRRERARAAVRLSSDLIAVTHCNNVDVVVLNDATPELIERATEDGVRVYCAGEEADRRFRLLSKLRYIDLIPFLRRNRRIKLKALAS